MATAFQPLRRCALISLLSVVGATGHAQHSTEWPSKPVTLIVAWPAGGGGDIVGRVLADKLQRLLGQPVVVDNRAGASGTIGTMAASRAAPDGYTLLLGQANNNVIAPAIFKVGYQTTEDFTPVTYIGYTPNVLVTNTAVQAKTVAELVALSKKGEPVSYGSPGAGSTAAIAGAQFSQLAGAPMIHVPYKGSSAMQTDLISGRVTMSFDTMPSVIASIHAGKLKALAISTPQRVSALPHVPTFAEAGLRELKMTNWYSVMGPKGLAPEIVAKLDGAVKAALADPELRAKLQTQGLIYGGPATPAEFAAFVGDEAQRYRTLVRDLAIKGE